MLQRHIFLFIQLQILESSNPEFDFNTFKNSFLFYKTVTSQFKDPDVLRQVKDLIPRNVQEGDFVTLLKWFHEFMNWIPYQIVCSSCTPNKDSNNPRYMEPKVETGSSWKVPKTEIHTCNNCGARQIYPRYNDVLQIAKTRTGRCGEWSIFFGAVLSSISLQSRIANDYLDHCWNEVLLDGKWIHVDSTFQYPDSFNNPHYYERNWKKQYLYVLAFSQDKVVDVTERYTDRMDAVLSRRKGLERHGNFNPSYSIEFQNFYDIIKSEYDRKSFVNE